MASGESRIDKAGVATALGALTYPLHYLDFETDALPIQRFAGMGPYQQFPFQFSLHVEAEDGRLEHFEYLHRDLHDPRPELLRGLLDSIGPVGSIVVFNQSFELRVLDHLAAVFPDRKPELDDIKARVVDLLPIVKGNVLDPGFEGSYSIKHVLPVLVPGLGYEGRVVANGSDAQAFWDKAIRMPPSAQRDEIFGELLAYCEMDTLGMVEIKRVLEKMAAAED